MDPDRHAGCSPPTNAHGRLQSIPGARGEPVPRQGKSQRMAEPESDLVVALRAQDYHLKDLMTRNGTNELTRIRICDRENG